MSLQAVVGPAFAPTDHDHDTRNSLLHALALGMGSGPLEVYALLRLRASSACAAR